MSNYQTNEKFQCKNNNRNLANDFWRVYEISFQARKYISDTSIFPLIHSKSTIVYDDTILTYFIEDRSTNQCHYTIWIVD